MSTVEYVDPADRGPLTDRLRHWVHQRQGKARKPAAPDSSQVRVIPKDLAAELGGQGGQPFRVSQKLLLALANDRLEESLQSGRRHQG